MSEQHLGLPIDLHGGGKDLVFPHHTNEIAQSAAAVGDGRTAESFCRHWMHHGFVEIDSEKMSKSLGNFFTIREVLAKFDPEVMRLFLLGTHYRNPINYSDAILQEAERRLRYLYKTLDKVDRLAQGTSPAGVGGAVVEDARRALDDDFNAPQVLAILAEAFTAANVLADRKGKKAPEDKAKLAAFARDVREIGTTLGLLQRPPAVALAALRARAAERLGIDAVEVEARIAERAAARKAKDFARGDAIRDELLARGVALLDGPDGTTWDVE
jgi:cysteinyl-tRNA synthetase